MNCKGAIQDTFPDGILTKVEIVHAGSSSCCFAPVNTTLVIIENNHRSGQVGEANVLTLGSD